MVQVAQLLLMDLEDPEKIIKSLKSALSNVISFLPKVLCFFCHREHVNILESLRTKKKEIKNSGGQTLRWITHLVALNNNTVCPTICELMAGGCKFIYILTFVAIDWLTYGLPC